MKRILSITLIILSLLLSVVAPVSAARSNDNPGRGHPEFEKYVFVHYADGFAKKGGSGNSAPQLYSYSGYHWPTGNVFYWMNSNSSRVAGADFINGITASFQAWQDDPASQITFAYQGITSAVPGLNASIPDYQNVVGWAYLSDRYPGAIAVTMVWSARGSKHIIDSDTALNTDGYFAWTQSYTTSDPDTALIPGTTRYDVDVQSLMTHEAGHWLQLNDLYASAAADQTMYGYAADRELKKRSLESGDLAGIQRIYP